MALKGMPVQGKRRNPSKVIAKKAAKSKVKRELAREHAQKVEAKFRHAGGYGKAVVSVWEIPPGGIKNSPAYKKVLQRSGGVMLPPERRHGAPVKGGFPLSKYPPNVLVDVVRAAWLPDGWAQVVKNTGPGGVYFGWLSPEGKFYYHAKTIEADLGRKLTALDGFNGTLRAAREIVKPAADKQFLQQCLSAAERKHVIPASGFHFCVVSARRATIEQGIADIMMVEGHFKAAGAPKPLWYVDAESLQAYKKLGLNAKVGGKLTPARNMALDDAKLLGKVCVQISDDISKWQYLDVSKQCKLFAEKTFEKTNAALAGTHRHCISPLAAAQFLLAKMRGSPSKPKLGGVFPTANAALTLGTEEFLTEHFILGDFFVAEACSPVRFDSEMTLKEDYDYTCSHIKAHGSVLRANRLLLTVKHSTNGGGAVATRDASGSKERYNIEILMRKWPGVFKLNSKRRDEVLMKWSHYAGNEVASAAGESGKSGKPLKVKKSALKFKAALKVWKKAKRVKEFPPSAMLKFAGGAESKAAPYVTKRCKSLHNRSVDQALSATFVDASGKKKKYTISDLRYDVKAERLTVVRAK